MKETAGNVVALATRKMLLMLSATAPKASSISLPVGMGVGSESEVERLTWPSTTQPASMPKLYLWASDAAESWKQASSAEPTNALAGL